MNTIRKIIILLFTLSLFLMISDIYEEKELSDVHNIFGLRESHENLVFSISSDISKEDMEDYVEDLRELADKTNATLISQTIKNHGKKFNYYYHSQVPLHKLLDLTLNKSDHSLVYSNHLSYGNRLTMMNEEIQVTFEPFEMISEVEDQKYYPLTAFAENHQDLLSFKKGFLANYEEIIDSVDEMQGDQFKYNQNYRIQIMQFFVFALGLYLIISLFAISDHLKAISIMKLHGYGFIEIGMNLLLKVIFEILILEITLTLILVAYKTIRVGPLPALMLRDYFYGLGLVNLALIATLAINVTLVKFIELPKLLKGLNYNKVFLYLSMVTKIIMIILIVPMLSPPLNGMIESGTVLYQVNRDTKELKKSFYVENTHIKDRFDGYQPMVYLWGDTDEVFNDQKAVYDHFNNQDQLIYQELTNFGVESSTNNNDVIFYEGFKVNQKYMEESRIKDVNGDLLSLNLEGNTVYVLIPESIYENTAISKELFTIEEKNPVKLMIIADQDYINYGMPYGNIVLFQEEQKTPYFVVYSEQSFRYNQSILFGAYLIGFDSKEAVEQELLLIGQNKSYLLQDSDLAGLNFRKDILNSMKKEIIMLLPGLGVFIISSLSVFILYFRTTIKRRRIYKYMGYDFFHANFDLLGKTLLTLILPTLILLNNVGSSVIFGMILFMLLDATCWGYIQFKNRVVS